jgi:hypothetical protein
VDEATLATLDSVEGYSPQCPDAEVLYARREADIWMFDGRQQKVAFYQFNQQHSPKLIAHGDYRRYLREAHSAAQWVIAFGRHLSRARLREQIGAAEECRVGVIPDYELVFNKRACTGEQTDANLQYAPYVHTAGVAYCLNSAQLARLDRCEGVPAHALRVTLPFWEEGTAVRSLLQGYLAHPRQLGEGEPARESLSDLRAGYAEHGLGEPPLALL